MRGRQDLLLLFEIYCLVEELLTIVIPLRWGVRDTRI